MLRLLWDLISSPKKDDLLFAAQGGSDISRILSGPDSGGAIVVQRRDGLPLDPALIDELAARVAAQNKNRPLERQMRIRFGAPPPVIISCPDDDRCAMYFPGTREVRDNLLLSEIENSGVMNEHYRYHNKTDDVSIIIRVPEEDYAGIDRLVRRVFAKDLGLPQSIQALGENRLHELTLRNTTLAV